MTAVSGELEQWGFDEVEPGLVVDSSENKRRLSRLEGDWQYERVKDEDGLETGLIRILSPAMLVERRDSVFERRKPLLVDPENPWSDYVEPDDYPLDPDVPYFIKERLAKWKRAEREGIPEDERQPFPVRCTTFRHDGTRCWNWASNPKKLDRCKAHQGWAVEERAKTMAYAKQRIMEATPDAVDRLAFLMENGETHAVQLKASTEILDRGGVRAGQDLDVHVDVEVHDPTLEVKEKLAELAKRHHHKEELEARAVAARALPLSDEHGTVVPGEVVEHDPSGSRDGSE